MCTETTTCRREPWNKGKLIGQKAPLKPKDIWTIRVRLQMEHRVREFALFNLGLDSKLRGCDLVALKVRDVCHGSKVESRAMVMQRKTQRPVQFEITAHTREEVDAWIHHAGLKSEDYLFPSRIHGSHPISAPASTLEFSTAGSVTLGWTPLPLARTPCTAATRQ